jgi:hypothetical protein
MPFDNPFSRSLWDNIFLPASAALVLGHQGNREREMQRKFDFYRGDFFHFSKSGPVQTGRPPAGRGGRMGVGVFARLQHTPGIRQWTRELRTGSRSVPQYGTRIRDRVPALREH